MKKLTAEFIAKSTAGDLIQGPPAEEILGVSIDSRTIQKGEVFFAIRGERFDGHDFINEAIEKGARALVVDRPVEVTRDIALIKVEDTTKALQDLARAYRLLFRNLKVIAITGSAGKTTTKDIIAALLEKKYRTRKTRGNLNNFFGLPLTLLAFDGEEEVAVLEMGMSQLSEISLLAEIAKPEIAVITNVGKTHLESLLSVENVAKGKGELITSLPAEGVAILNYDNDYVRNMGSLFPGRKIYYGLKGEADLYADNIVTFQNRMEFDIHYENEVERIKLDRTGLHNVYNALAAIAVARLLGITWQEIREGLMNVDYSSLRWDVQVQNGITIINDAYNANPLSMEASISAAKDMKGKRLVLALGAMLELGEEEESAHLQLGEYVSGQGVALLITVGEIARLIAKGAREKGMPEDQIVECENNQVASEILSKYLQEGDVLLVKGSRGLKMEEIVRALL